MQENYLFEYAVVRVVPKVEREEFLNVGVIIYCAKLKFLKMSYELKKERFAAFSHEIDLEEIEGNLQAFKRVSEGGPKSGPIGQLDLASRFRWLTATRSTLVQTSKVHPGLCTAPEETFKRLFEQLVS